MATAQETARVAKVGDKLKTMPVVAMEKVSKCYLTDGTSVPALQEIDFAAAPGEFVALVGRSGCGKSTMLNLAGAMDFPTSGSVLVDGVCTSTLDDAGLTRLRREKVGFIFQFFQLLPTLTAAENVELPLLLAGKTRVRPAALERLRWVEMEHLADRFPHQLSGGQMQRVAIARALIHSPQLLLADEPIGNLDSTTGETVLALLRRTASEFNTTILMATHSLESTAWVDTVVRLKDGHVEDIERKQA